MCSCYFRFGSFNVHVNYSYMYWRNNYYLTIVSLAIVNELFFSFRVKNEQLQSLTRI